MMDNGNVATEKDANGTITKYVYNILGQKNTGDQGLWHLAGYNHQF